MKRILRRILILNLLSASILIQQFHNIKAEQGGEQYDSPMKYEYAIKPLRILQATDEAEKLYSFAGRLLDSGDYGQAFLEFRRFLHYFPDHRLSGEAGYAAAWAHFKGGLYDEATAWFRRVYMSSDGEELSSRALYMMAESDYMSGDYKSAIEVYGMVSEGYKGGYLDSRASFMKGWAYLKMGRWREASNLFSSQPSYSPYLSPARSLSEESLHGLALESKSPALAGALSAYLPGAGQLYVGRKRDALVAFLINQGFIIGGVASIFSGNIFLGVTLLALEAGWYSGNIYSALNGAYKHNRWVRQDFVAALDLKYGLR